MWFQCPWSSHLMHWLLWWIAIYETPQVIESCYHGNRDTFVTLLFEGSWSSCLGSIFFVPVEFCNTILLLWKCYERATKLFMTKSCAEIIACRASCFLFVLPLVSDRSQELNCNPKMWVALFRLTTTDSILIRTPLLSSSKTHAPQPTALSRGFYWNLNSAFSNWIYCVIRQIVLS